MARDSEPAPLKYQREGTETMGREQISDFRAYLTRARESRKTSALALQVALLKGAVEGSSKAIGGRGADIAELQRTAIASLHECAETILKIANLVDDSARPSDAVSRYLGAGGGARVAFAEQASDFFEYARNFVLNLADAGSDGGLRSARSAPAPALVFGGGFHERLEQLSPSQKRAFDLLVKGLPNKLIAYELGLAESTVKAHMSALFRKLQVRSRTHAIAMAASIERERSLVSEFASGAPFFEDAPLPEPKASSSPCRDSRPPLRRARMGS